MEHYKRAILEKRFYKERANSMLDMQLNHIRNKSYECLEECMISDIKDSITRDSNYRLALKGKV